MKIQSLSFKDIDRNWYISNLELEDLTLLVGASGVGKTKILDCIEILRDLVLNLGNFKYKSISWNLKFTLLNNNHYEWKGVRLREDGFLEEEILLNGESFVKREDGKVILSDGIKLKLNNESSLLYLLSEDERVEPVIQAFGNIIYNKWFAEESDRRVYVADRENLKREDYSIQQIQELQAHPLTKFYLSDKCELPVRKEIEARFVDIFPFVKDVTIIRARSSGKQEIVLGMDEVGVDIPIFHLEFSSGMYKTFLQLCELYLSPAGTVFLIDEFENSLGINCIDELTTVIQSAAQRNIQFVITSHHPYIINQIHYKNWKLVTRAGGEVKVQNATDLMDFSKSRQQAFMQLTQLEEFTTGISE
jgi:predicted ATPase